MAAQISGLAVFALLFAALYYLATGVGLNRSLGGLVVFMLLMSERKAARDYVGACILL